MNMNENIKEKNPIAGMVSFGSEDKDLFCLDYRITTKCNYSCWYCTDMHNNSKKNGKFNIDPVQKMIKILDRDIRFFFYGGEPTIHPNFTEAVCGVLEYLSSGSILEIQTNLSLNKERFRKTCRTLDKDRKSVV